MALANQVIDFVDDIDKGILKQIASSASPEMLKTAQVLTFEEREQLEPEQFALVVHTADNQTLRKFPISDASNTWLSAQYFEKTAEQLPYVAQKIAASYLAQACSIFNLKAPECITKLASKDFPSNRYQELRDHKKTAAPKASTPVKPDGSAHFFALGENYAMPSAEYVKKASAYFTDHYREFEDAEDRHTFADNVLARAKELNVTLEEQEQLEKYASDEYGTVLEAQLKLRQNLLEFKPEMSAALGKLAAQKDQTDPKTFARALHLFDKKAGLTRYHGKYLDDAFRSTFADLYKSAGYRWEDEATGLSVDEKELVKAASNKEARIKAFFGQTFTDSFKKHAVAIFESLPNDAKETMVKIIKGVI